MQGVKSPGLKQGGMLEDSRKAFLFMVSRLLQVRRDLTLTELKDSTSAPFTRNVKQETQNMTYLR